MKQVILDLIVSVLLIHVLLFIKHYTCVDHLLCLSSTDLQIIYALFSIGRHA